MPTEAELYNMWTRNSNGAGVMYAVDGIVHIEKGFMTWKDFSDRLTELAESYDLKELPVVLHFRITTHGGTKPENCHPFPITDSIGMLKKLKLTTKVGVAHNGIIPVTPRNGISDTMEYIAGQLAPLSRVVPEFYKSKDLMQMILHATGSKLAFLDGDGTIYTVGEFVEHNGVYYSNTSYQSMNYLRDFSYYSSGWSKWDSDYGYSGCLADRYEDDDDDDDGSNRIYKPVPKKEAKLDWYYQNMMWLDEGKGEYVHNYEDGESIYFGEFAIDDENNVYEYDEDVDLMRPLPMSYVAYNQDGMILRYDPMSNMISKELVIVS
jgi:hypothetical protein